MLRARASHGVGYAERGRELAAEWEKRGWRMPLRIGAAMGHATIGAIGFEERLDYGVVGRVNRIAAALCNAAEVRPRPRLAEDRRRRREVEPICWRSTCRAAGTTRNIRAFKVLGIKT